MSIKHYFRKNCRLCESSNLELVLKLTPTPLCDAYVQYKQEQEIFPLNLCLCKECGFVQIDCVLFPEDIYRNYLYKTTSSTGLGDHFKSYAKSAIRRLKLSTNSTVVDIGSNEGTLLKHFKKLGMQVIGVDASKIVADSATLSGIYTFNGYFNEILAEKILRVHGRADIITMNNTFANIDDLAGLTRGMLKLLSPEGTIIIESSYLGDMINNLVFDFIYHEHLSYLSILPLKKFFSVFNMELVDLEHVQTKGGSMRYYFARKSSSNIINPKVFNWIEKEKKSKINDYQIYKTFEERINACKKKLIKELEELNSKVYAGYGASATSTTFIYHFGLQNFLHFLVDDNSAKIGTYSPGLNLPVKDSTYLYEAKVDTIVVLAWRFADQIKKKHKEYKGRIIVPMQMRNFE